MGSGKHFWFLTNQLGVFFPHGWDCLRAKDQDSIHDSQLTAVNHSHCAIPVVVTKYSLKSPHWKSRTYSSYSLIGRKIHNPFVSLEDTNQISFYSSSPKQFLDPTHHEIWNKTSTQSRWKFLYVGGKMSLM